MGTKSFLTYLDGLSASTTGVSKVAGLNAAGSAVVAVAPSFYTPEDFGAVGDGVTDDLTALEACIAAARTAGVPVHGRGFYFIEDPLVIERPDDVEYWDGTTEQRPISIYLDRIKTSSTDAAIKFTGSLISDSLEIGHLIGPGMGAVGTPGAGIERIGVILTGPVEFKIRSVTDCNFGIVMQECYSSKVDIGFAMACLKGVYSRITPGSSTATNQRNNIRIRKPGGPFTSEAFPNDALRRERGCDTGVHLASEQGSRIDLGSAEYCQQETDSVAVIIDSGVTKNDIHVYLEGARDDGEFIQCAGINNRLYFSGLGSPSDVKVGAIRVTGVGNDIYGLGDVVGAAAKAVFAPMSSFGIVQIVQGNTVHGKYKQQVQKDPSILRLNLLTDATSFTASGGGLTVSTSTSDIPAGHDFKESYQFTTADTDTYWYTSGNITITSETLTTVKVKTAVKGVTGHPKVGFYLLTSGGTILSGEQSITADPANTDWNVIEYLAEIGTGLTNILFRFAMRGNAPGETGGVVKVCRPLMTFNLDHPMARTNDVMQSGQGLWADHIPKNIYNYQGFSYKPQIVTDIVSTVFDVNSRACAICTAHPTGSSVNAINNLIEDQPTMIINASGSSITFTTSSGAWTSSQVLADGEAMTVLRTTGTSTFTSDVWRVG